MKRYIFRYSPEPTESGVINRPKVTVFLLSKTEKWQSYRAYIDSGADMSLFRRNDANLLGLNLTQGEYHPIKGVGGVLIPAYLHTVQLRIGGSELKVMAAFADSDEVPRLLGRMDIFPFFKITFVERDLEILFETFEQ